MHPKDKERFVEAGATSARTAVPYEIEYEIVCLDGKLKFINEIGKPHYDKHGNVVEFAGVAQDITARRIAQRASIEQGARAGAILEAALDAIVTIGEHGVIELTNVSTEKIFGYDPGELYGQRVEVLMPEPYKSEHSGYIERFIRTGVPGIIGSSREVMGMRKDGTRFPMRLAVTEVAFGDTRLFTAIVHDLTEQAELEKQLRQAQKLEAIGTLAGGIAHDFNNILQAVLGFAIHALKITEKGTTVHTCLAEIEAGGKRAAELVAQILAFSRTEERENRPLDFASIVEEALKLCRSTLPSTIEIRRDIDIQAGLVLAGATELHQLVLNLCTNAHQSMSQKGGVLDVTLDKFRVGTDHVSGPTGVKPGDYIRLRVTDTGEGMDPATLERIFDPFYTTKEVGEGTGLGLSTAYGIVTECDGYISVESTLGEGSEFTVLLPLYVGVLDPDEGERKISTIHAGGSRVLFVDDEAAVVKMTMMVLERNGYSVHGCTSSVEALEIFRKAHESFDIVVSDLTMPTLTGIELAKELRTINEAIPIILCTGHAEEEVFNVAHNEIEQLVVLKKPIDIDMLLGEIDKALN